MFDFGGTVNRTLSLNICSLPIGRLAALVCAVGMCAPLTGCGNKTDAKESNFRPPIEAFLAKQRVCFDSEAASLDPASTTDLKQPAWSFLYQDPRKEKLRTLQALGLVKAVNTRLADLELTDTGKHASDIRPGPFGMGRGLNLYFCYGKAKLDKIVKWEGPSEVLGSKIVMVTYRSSITDIPDWARDKQIQAVYPDLGKNVTTSSVEDAIPLHLTNLGWEQPEEQPNSQ
jgi:hypothetical protein